VSRGAGTPKEQAQRKQVQLARAQQDQTYSRQVFGTWPPPTTAAPAHSAAASGPGTAGTSPAQRRRRKKADLDVAYRQALGLKPDQPLPGALGQVDPGQADVGGASKTARKGRRAAGGAKAGAGKSRKPRGKNGSSTTPRSGTQHAGRPGRTATSAITCPTCSTAIAKGAPIATWDQQVMHPACRDALQAKARTLAGVTYRGHKPSDWRLGSSPSNGPA
jgi:hypothetical protein